MIPPAGAPALSPIPTGYHRPPSLILHERPPKLAYLDLNHWVEFSKAMAGHPGGEPYREALDACLDAVERRTALFPLADAIYMEVSRIASYRQRRDLADVMQALSRFVVITSRSLIATTRSKRCWTESSDRGQSRSPKWRTSTGASRARSAGWAAGGCGTRRPART